MKAGEQWAPLGEVPAILMPFSCGIILNCSMVTVCSNSSSSMSDNSAFRLFNCFTVSLGSTKDPLCYPYLVRDRHQETTNWAHSLFKETFRPDAPEDHPWDLASLALNPTLLSLQWISYCYHAIPGKGVFAYAEQHLSQKGAESNGSRPAQLYDR